MTRRGSGRAATTPSPTRAASSSRGSAPTGPTSRAPSSRSCTRPRLRPRWPSRTERITARNSVTRGPRYGTPSGKEAAMSDTELKHFLIRDYLRELSAACVTLPAAQARELREQITAHLDEALPPDATAEEVQAELDRLGRPRSLAAEAAGPGWQPVARRLRNWLGHVRWWVWVALVLVVSMVATGAGLLISMRTAAPLQQASTFGWYFPQDQGHDVET